MRFDSLQQFLDDGNLNGYDGGMRLVKATIKRFADHCHERGIELPATFSVRYESDIPRQVGLAGSSAIVTATLRGLCAFFAVSIPDDELPSLTLAVETDELGIAAGLQDRVAQAYEGLVYMDFEPAYVREHGHGRYERLDPGLLPGLYVAYQEEAAERSTLFHTDIRRRFERGDPEVLAAMERLARRALDARAALLAQDHGEFDRLIDLGFDTRRSIYDLDSRHVRMVEIARELGVCATFAGSGGAVVGTCRDDATRTALTRAFADEGCVLIDPQVG